MKDERFYTIKDKAGKEVGIASESTIKSRHIGMRVEAHVVGHDKEDITKQKFVKDKDKIRKAVIDQRTK